MKTEKESMRSTLDSILAKVNMIRMNMMVNMMNMMIIEEEETGKNKNEMHIFSGNIESCLRY